MDDQINSFCDDCRPIKTFKFTVSDTKRFEGLCKAHGIPFRAYPKPLENRYRVDCKPGDVVKLTCHPEVYTKIEMMPKVSLQ